MPRATKSKAEVDLVALVAKAQAALADEGMVKLTSLGPKAARARVVDELVTLGFEVTRSAVRRPLGAQLLAALDDGAYIPLKSIAAFARGGTAAEAKAAATALVQAGRARRAIRGSAEVLVPESAVLLSPEDLQSAQRACDGLAKEVGKARKTRGASLLRDDAVERLRPLLSILGVGAPRVVAERLPPTDPLTRVLEAVQAAHDERMGLSFIPNIMERLRAELPLDSARTALLEAAQRGLIELRPEGGLNRLTPDELEMCLSGPQGTRLSWARRVEGRAP